LISARVIILQVNGWGMRMGRQHCSLGVLMVVQSRFFGLAQIKFVRLNSE